MNLAQALRLARMDSLVSEEPPLLGLVGAGGKTTAIFQISRELPTPVIVTATTHLAVGQLSLADRHILARSPGDLDGLEDLLPGNVILVTGPQAEEERVSGVDPATLDRLHSFAWDRHIPLLIEADGSRQRPVKAPEEHEPALPPFVKQVIVVAGLSALGKPLTEAWVHRPERFAALSGLNLGLAITVDGLAEVLNSQQGGLKRIPPGARRIALLTQADTDERRAAADQLAARLLPAYHAVVIASLHPGDEPFPGESKTQVSSAELPDPKVFSVREPAAGILLAAGGSSRMGRPKQLLPWQGEPLVRYVASKALAAGLSPVIVVTGAFHDQVSRAVADLPVTIIENQEWESGQSSSVRAGLKALPEETGAAVFLLVDQPQVTVSLLHALVSLHGETLAPVAAPKVGGQRANPVLFDRSTFPDLMAIRGDVGGRGLFSRYPVAWLNWPDEKLLQDIDTEEDYRRLQNNPLP